MPVPWPAVVSRAILTGHPSVLSMMIFSEFIIFLIPASSPTPRCVPGCIIMHGMERVLHRFISSMSAFIDFVLRELLADARFMRYALWARILKFWLYFLLSANLSISSFSKVFPLHWFAFFVKSWIAVQES